MSSFKNTHAVQVVMGLDLLEVLDDYCLKAKISRPSMIRWILWTFLRSPIADEALTLWESVDKNEIMLDELIEENL